MEDNYKSQVVDSKRIYQFSWFSRLLSVVFPILFPWKRILKSKVSTGNVSNETFILFKNSKLNGTDQDKTSQIKIPVDEIAGLLNWPEITDEVKRNNGFRELIRLFNLYCDNDKPHDSDVVGNSSNCWILLAAKNCDQLLEHGYSNFKRTIGHNYFNFLVQKGDTQIQAVESLLPAEVIASCHHAALSIPQDPAFPAKEQFSYYYFVLLLWEYVKRIDTKNYLEKLEEPKEGNPILVHANEKSMSQDLANSLIEYYSIDNAVSFRNINTILEIGGGYGRDAHVILSLRPNTRIVMVDIMPALYVAQRYLCSVFHEKHIFKARSFSCYEEVRTEIEESSIVFLLPHQLTLLPDKYFDLSMNISSFGEINLDQIQWYFTQINRLTSKYFYMKQWDVSQNPFDGLKLQKSDYPAPENWREIYSRNCTVQNEFFETLYQVNN